MPDSDREYMAQRAERARQDHATLLNDSVKPNLPTPSVRLLPMSITLPLLVGSSRGKAVKRMRRRNAQNCRSTSSIPKNPHPIHRNSLVALRVA